MLKQLTTDREEQQVLHPDLWALVGYLVTNGQMYADWEYYEAAILVGWFILNKSNPYRNKN